ncbi:probable inactive tRNA-specific adenosine deaminase-like protein 3 isoform X3 [Prunus persica]|uniref:probable inactive tRNA-specific adenosine deaminase-like protein 3 isoform X3 n=1 Tax=Prunus persica TaxID=3760 RepID=UPI0009AB979E|nr:probable inactive tRNA-specific adenosine deaminase-like protein 3 isoform X3 [Prunus persica]
MDTWQILHIPDNPPIAPDQQPTVDAIASLIDPKFANTLVRRLNQISPLENLRHVKRVKKKFVEGGKTQLSVILCLASENGNQLESMQNDVQELMNSYKLSPFITKVCKYAALSKEEWEEQCKLWPTSYHPPTYNIDGITGFSEEDSQSVFRFMKYAIQLAKSSDNLVHSDDNLTNGEGSSSLSARPYLCTGFDMYLVWEPCIMCAMALVHQRIRRIFFAFPNPDAGALGSVHRLQGETSLNHHYAVFRVLVPQQILSREG